VAIFHEDPRVQEAYRRADLILADGWPIGLAAKWQQNRRLSIVPGSVLLPTWVQKLEKPARFLVVGGKNGLATVQALHSLSDLVEDVGFDDSTWLLGAEDPKKLTGLLESFQPDVLLLLLGSPKQEVLAMAAIEAGFKGLILCLGATGDFLAQIPKRAPELVQRAGLEWLYRITQEPTRLGPRYLKSLKPFLKAIKK
jgi:N-acetylglucosaminyldiphosphoundecaprenol N-acetyl-beta-D-mannosaminyltransferase